jgi:hypothetical protein
MPSMVEIHPPPKEHIVLSTKSIVLAGAGIATAAGLALLGASFAGAAPTTAATAAYGYGGSAPTNGETGQSGERPRRARTATRANPNGPTSSC